MEKKLTRAERQSLKRRSKAYKAASTTSLIFLVMSMFGRALPWTSATQGITLTNTTPALNGESEIFLAFTTGEYCSQLEGESQNCFPVEYDRETFACVATGDYCLILLSVAVMTQICTIISVLAHKKAGMPHGLMKMSSIVSAFSCIALPVVSMVAWTLTCHSVAGDRLEQFNVSLDTTTPVVTFGPGFFIAGAAAAAQCIGLIWFNEGTRIKV